MLDSGGYREDATAVQGQMQRKARLGFEEERPCGGGGIGLLWRRV